MKNISGKSPNSSRKSAPARSAEEHSPPILFIGDPHVTSTRIARRIDNYKATVVDKLAQCVLLAERLSGQIVILGDLFDRARETDIGLLTRLIGIFRQARRKPIVLTGNHDRSGARLTDDTTLYMLGLAGVVTVIDEPSVIDIGDMTLRFVPYGYEIPRAVKQRGKLTVMVTHHDLAIEPNTNPQAMPIFEIVGVDLVVNGHDHTFKPPVRCGNTVYFNPGNIARVSISQLDHEPAVHVLSAQNDDRAETNDMVSAAYTGEIAVIGGARIDRYRLAFQDGRAVFDMTGYNATDGTDAALSAFMSSFAADAQTRFIEALREESSFQAAGGGDAVHRVIREVMDDMGVDGNVRKIIENELLKLSD